jgi:hypothetical protein
MDVLDARVLLAFVMVRWKEHPSLEVVAVSLNPG